MEKTTARTSFGNTMKRTRTEGGSTLRKGGMGEVAVGLYEWLDSKLRE